MATGTILHLGDDLCYRIPLMEQAGLISVRTECSVKALQTAFTAGQAFSGIAFHSEPTRHFGTVVETAHRLSTAPLILFRNSLADCDERMFDLIVPVQTPPDIWLKSLQETIGKYRRLRETSERLRQECVDVRVESDKLKQISARNCETSVDHNAFWRGKPE
jgi:hypothetical protein